MAGELLALFIIAAAGAWRAAAGGEEACRIMQVMLKARPKRGG